MERFAQRENVLLGYSPQRACGNQSSSPKTPLKNPDIDFHDVFGGPPRRSSMQEMRYSFTETMNSTKNTIQGEEDTDLPLSPWSGLNGMPVFGGETVNRRRGPSDDFFDDIFRGDESSSSPRRSNNDPFGSTPGSRVLSPARSLPPIADHLGSSLRAPSQFSLSAKLTKAMESPVFASGNHNPYRYKDSTSNGISCLYTPSSPLSRLSSEAFQEEDELRNEIWPSYRPSPLSHEFSLSSKEPLTKSSELESTDIGGNLKSDLKSTEAPSNSSRFHFSIYKWASKGVPLSMPFRGGNSTKAKERDKIERCSSFNGRIQSGNMANGLQADNWHDSDHHFLNVSANNYTEVRKQDGGSLLKTSTEDTVEPCHVVEEAVLSMPGSKSINKFPNIVETVPGDAILSDKREEIEPHSLSETGFCENTEKGIAMSGQDAEKPELKSLHSLLSTNEGQGNDEIIRKFEGKDSMVKKTIVCDSNADISENVMKCYEKGVYSNRAEVIRVNEPHLQHSSRTSGDILGRNKIKGKVREFVKIFNQEATSKPKIDIDTKSQSSRWKRTGTFGADNEGSANTIQTNGKNHARVVNKMKTPPNASVMVDKNLEESKKQQSQLKTTVFNVSENYFGQNDASASSSESIPDGSKAMVGNIDDLFEDNFMVKELSNDQDKVLQTDDGYEDIQISDAKIRQWSNGKEGNIRSLLSTLHYVLWPGSGWKPVPLVDIIEGNAVKRSYQKALLCLHPDKLQQKSAASQQKYIAQKVFDILQEAWDHFNSLGAI